MFWSGKVGKLLRNFLWVILRLFTISDTRLSLITVVGASSLKDILGVFLKIGEKSWYIDLLLLLLEFFIFFFLIGIFERFLLPVGDKLEVFEKVVLLF